MAAKSARFLLCRFAAAFAIALLSASGAAQGFRLNGPLVAGGDVAEFRISPDGSRAVYRADQEIDGVHELFSVSTDGGPSRKLNGALAPGGQVGLDFVHSFRISPDGSRVIYWADQEVDELFELFSAPIDGSQAPVKLNGPLVTGGDVLSTPSFLLADAFAPMTPDGSRVFYLADQEEDDRVELYSVPSDGSQPPVKLNGPLVPGGDVLGSLFFATAVQIAPDADWAVYLADQDTDDVIELYGVPLAGGTPPVKLSHPLDPDGDVFSVQLSPDGAWALYVASENASGPMELFRVPLRGTPDRARHAQGQDRIRLSLPLGPFEGVSRFRVSPDGGRVVYRANPQGGNCFELFGVRIDGGQGVRLSLPSDQTVFESQISPDGARVVYSAGGEEQFNAKLYSVPSDGSEQRIQISALSSLGYVGGSQIARDSSRAVYSLILLGGAAEVHSAPLDGSASAVRLNPDGTSAGGFQISLDGEHVVFLQQALFFPLELYGAPIDGRGPPRRLSGPLVPGGNVGGVPFDRPFLAGPDGRVLYRADQDTDEVFELYESFLERPHRRR